jgi:hypothetical protein
MSATHKRGSLAHRPACKAGVTEACCPFTHKSSLVSEAPILSYLNLKDYIVPAKRLKRSQLTRVVFVKPHTLPEEPQPSSEA